MGDYSGVPERLLERINISGRILAREIPDVIGAAGAVHCYPGILTSDCFDTAYFISLNGRRHGRGHLKFGEAVEKLIEHMQGRCKSTTQAAVLIADTWDDEELRGRQTALDSIKQMVHIEAYLFSCGTMTQIEL